MNTQFKKWNNRLGILMLIIASAVYLLTMERSVSFWDCGEYIVVSTKLGVAHAPGAAMFQLLGAVWSAIAMGDTSKYPIAINSMSAISSALTIMFLFWTITHLARRMFHVTRQNEMVGSLKNWEMSKSQIIIALGSGVVGASIFMFSDSFWFSAVEGEVYAMASMFTAAVLWMGCKWEEESDKKRADRWFLLISFVIGLSLGVHFMVILALPAVLYLYYARNFKFTWKTFIIANIVIAAVLAFVYKFLFEFVMTLFGRTEIYVVNNFGMPFNSGTLVAGIILVLIFYLLIRITSKRGWKLGNTLVLSVIFMILGFSCWLVLPIRANANPPINLNDPDTALGMLDYFNREQYGDWPTTYGPVYVAHIADDGVNFTATGATETKVVGANYVKDNRLKKYVKVSDRREPIYNKKYVKFFPKMFDSRPDVMENYARLYGFPEFSMNPMFFNDMRDDPELRAQKRQYAEQIYGELVQKRERGSLTVAELSKNAEFLNIEPPTFQQQLNFFFDFQLGYMGFRYFMWNFSGKQNDWEGNKEVTRGNWISGFPFIDNPRLGNQKELPAVFKENKGRNVYFMLPLLLGLIGFCVQFNRNFTHWWAILSLFMLTSVGILFYTSVKPFEPRERDYALVSSFYAFAIWSGLGVQGIWLLFKKVLKDKMNPSVSVVLGVLCLGVPLLMGFQNWDDHDRSNRRAAHALAYNYIKDLDKEAILFVYGDNDTYPLWGVNETSNLRPDVKIVNYTLLGAPWYMEQMLRKTYEANPLPSKLKYTDFQLNTNDQIMVAGNSIRSVFENINSLIRPGTELSLGEIMSLPADQIEQFIHPDYDPEGIKKLYYEVQPLEKYLVKDSMTVKEAYEFLMDNKSREKQALFNYFEIEPGSLNFLPVSKLILPVNKENALKHGIIDEKDAALTEDYLTIKLGSRNLYKAELMMISMLAEYDWDRSIYFSGGGISDPGNVFWLQDYLETNGFSYKLIPIYSSFAKGGKIGRSNPEKMYRNFQNFEWGNYNLKNASFSNTGRNYTNTYRNIAVRLADDLMEIGDSVRAKEALDKVMEMVPDEARYDYGLGTERIGLAYLRLGETEKGNSILNTVKDRALEKMNFYETLPGYLQYTIASEWADARSDYSMMVYDRVKIYLDKDDKEGALEIFKSEYDPVRNKLIDLFNQYNKGEPLSVNQERIMEKQFTFLSELLSVADMIDTVYAERESEELYNILTQEK